MRTFIENYLHFMKNCIRPHYEKLKSLKSGFIENSIFENNRDPWVELIVHLFICSAREKLWGTVVQRREIGCLFLNTSPPQRHFVYNNYVIMKYV